MTDKIKSNKALRHRRNRLKIIYAQVAVIAVITLTAILVSQIFFAQKRAESLTCYENGSVDYTVHLKENDFFTDESIIGGEVYVGELIDSIAADFDYSLKLDDKNATGEISYKIDALLEINDKASDASLFKEQYSVLEPTSARISDGRLEASCSANVDYDKYNNVAKEFISRYSLSGTKSFVKIVMSVDISRIEGYAGASDMSAYEIELSIPLAETTVRPTTRVSSDSFDPRTISLKSGSSYGMLVLLIALVATDMLAAAVLVGFAILSRSTVGEYEARVKRTLGDYKDYIQKVRNRYDSKDRQILYIDSFDEMLEVRDTVQMPILMYEDREAQSASFFVIPPSDVVYLFEISAQDEEQTDTAGRFAKKLKRRINDLLKK